MKKPGIDEECRLYGGEERCIEGFGVEICG
jgi:hypothetical protein